MYHRPAGKGRVHDCIEMVLPTSFHHHMYNISTNILYKVNRQLIHVVHVHHSWQYPLGGQCKHIYIYGIDSSPMGRVWATTVLSRLLGDVTRFLGSQVAR